MSTEPTLDHSEPPLLSGARPARVTVYGNDHSPWVQAVLLGAHDAGIPGELVAMPPLRVFGESGVLMPVAQVGDGDWLRDSERILVAMGEDPVAPELARLLGRLFLTCAMTRVDAAWTFWQRFSLVRDTHPNAIRRALHHVFRAVPVFYFFCLISAGARGRPRPDGDRIAGAFDAVQRHLPEDADYFGGETPSTADYQLFGIVQMCATLPGKPLNVLLHHLDLDPLRAWIHRMQTRFITYERLYTAQLFEPHSPARPTASPVEQGLFWLGAVACWLLAPVTIAATVFFAARVRSKGFLTNDPNGPAGNPD